jgi:hypothetical protein
MNNNQRFNYYKIYRVGAVAILVALLFFRRNLAAELVISNGFGIWQVPAPLPENALGWFALISAQPLLAFILLDGVDVINAILVVLLFFALFTAIKNHNFKMAAAALTATVLGVIMYILANRAIPLCLLARRYHAAPQLAARADLLMRADEILSSPLRDTVMSIGLILILSAGLVFSIVPLKEKIFKRRVALTGIAANGLYLMNYVLILFAPNLNWLFPTLSAPFRLTWYAMLAVALLKKAKDTSTASKLEERCT